MYFYSHVAIFSIILDFIPVVKSDASSFGNKIMSVTNEELGSRAFRFYLNSRDNIESKHLHPDVIVRALAKAIDRKFRAKEQAIARLQHTVKKSFHKKSWRRYTECCKYDKNLEHRPNFAGKVDVNAFCVMKASVANVEQNLPNMNFPATSPTRLNELSELQSHYFGSENGTLIRFPASHVPNCEDYDNRFRPWYVRASAPVAKDIALVLDMSGSMSLNNRLQGAIHAATTILETLSPDDRVAVVAFSDHAFVVGSGTTSGTTSPEDYGSFQKRRLSRSKVISSRHRAIVFLSDGEPSDHPTKILDFIYRRNRAMHNSVVLLCYALGEGSFGDFVRRMSLQSHVPANPLGCIPGAEIRSPCSASGLNLCSLTEPPKGFYKRVLNSRDLRSEMGSYYSFFATVGSEESDAEEVVWSVPYFDAGGIGMVVTAASAVVVENRLVGVVGSDITMRDMMADVTYFHTGGHGTYAFLMEDSGRILLHPYMPSPSSAVEDPVFTDFGALERSPEVRKFIRNIMHEPIASTDEKIYRTTVKTKTAIPQEHRNVMTRDAELSYSCIRFKHLIMCAVVEKNAEFQVHLRENYPEADISFEYHRFDVKSPKDACSYKGQLSSGRKSAVFFAPSAFLDIAMHLVVPENSKHITKLEDYMMNENDNTLFTKEDEAAMLNLRAGIRDVVRITSEFDKIWNGISSESRDNLFQDILFRYFSSENGVFRIYPGIKMPKSYNPVHRPWYIQATALLSHLHPEKTCISDGNTCGGVAAVSPPYLDASGAGVVITISQAIMTRITNKNGATSWHLLGVVGGDMKLSFLKRLLTEAVRECGDDSDSDITFQKHFDCILIDLAGYVIYDNMLTAMDETTIRHMANTSYHITFAHKALAYELFRKKILVRQQCADVSKVAYLEEYKIDLNRVASAEYPASFKAMRVNFTNTVLLLISKDVPLPNSHFRRKCIEHNKASDICVRPASSEQCESPCVNFKEAWMNYEMCTNSFNFTWEQHPPPCVPEKFVDERFGMIIEENGDYGNPVSDVQGHDPCL